MLFVICWSGTMAVFSRDIDHLLDPGVAASPRPERIAWGTIYDNVQRAHPDLWVVQMVAHHSAGTVVESWALDSKDITHRIYSDPATGEVIATRSFMSVQRFFRSFHMALFAEVWPVLNTPIGSLIVALFSIPLLMMLVTSLLFYRRFWRGFLKLDWRKGRKVFWSDVHKLTGLWSLWFVAVISVTGIWYLIERQLPEQRIPEVALSEPSRLLPIDTLIARAEAAYPQLRVTSVLLSDYESGVVQLLGQDGTLLVRDQAARIWMDSATARPLHVRPASTLSAYERWIDTADPLHFGFWGGIWSKAVWLVFGLALSGLCLTGAYLHVRRQQRQAEQGMRMPVLAAYGVTIACILLASWFGYREIMSFGIGGRAPQVPLGATLFIAAWVLSTLAALTLWMRAVR
jgi:uncharacterized iron-regulated membrane protein